MTIRRITISVPEETAKKIKKAAGKTPVSAWITEVVEERLSDSQLHELFMEFYRDVAPSPADVRRAGEIYDRITTPSGPSARAAAKPKRKRVA